MYYTYILRSINVPTQRYIGHSSDLSQRLQEHNAGKCPHTSKFAPWEIEWHCVFQQLAQAQDFERYLKSGSGHAFAARHLR
jgi:predicted GIY-YIG superfamily endonuclease